MNAMTSVIMSLLGVFKFLYIWMPKHKNIFKYSLSFIAKINWGEKKIKLGQMCNICSVIFEE